MRIATLPMLCALASMPLAASCARPPTPAGAATEAARCEAWRDSLSSRSGGDTQQTYDEIGDGYDIFLAACPGLGLPFD